MPPSLRAFTSSREKVEREMDLTRWENSRWMPEHAGGLGLCVWGQAWCGGLIMGIWRAFQSFKQPCPDAPSDNRTR